MDETKTQNEHDDDNSHEMTCPICLLMKTLSATRKKHSAFFDHFMKAQLELIKDGVPAAKKTKTKEATND